MAILGKYKAEILREWYAPDTDANIIQIAIDAGLNSVQVSMNREQIAAERAGSTSLRSLVAEALRRGLSVSILQGYQSYSGSVMPTQAHLDQQKADFLGVLQNIPGISGFELEEPGLETGGSDPWSPTQVNAGNIMRPLLTKWFRDLKAICAGFPLVTERGWNAMSLNYDWNYNSGIDFAVINSERLMTYIALQVPASPLYFDAEVTRFKGYVPNLEVGVWINVQSGNVPARVQHYYDAKIPFEILELQGLRSQAAMIRAILPAPPLPTQGTLNVTSTPSGANVLLSNNGGDFYQKFLLGGSSYGATGGSSSHNHSDQTVTLTTVTGTGSDGKVAGGTTSYASTTHTHTVGVTSFSAPSNLPPYVNVVFAKAQYYSSGTIASQVLDTTVTGSEWPELSWDVTLPSGTSITLEVRASDTAFLKTDATLSWTSVGVTSPVTTGLPAGRYKQWRAILAADVPKTSTPTLQEVRVYYQGN